MRPTNYSSKLLYFVVFFGVAFGAQYICDNVSNKFIFTL